ncbi:aldo/keto reductase [Streptococcus pantholopis]|uniref:Aldehyde oxidase n=2 Tax=Streptococcus pantholopis TaxID=1811193 RepID=A0A172Q743_9STRE|nr:aldehyde oxidase [Streptococcus pantholopis]
MTKRRLGKNLEVSSIGFGIMGMDHAYGAPKDRKEMIKLIHQAFDLGCYFFDTAPVYGVANEILLGQAIKGHPDAVIATKFGIIGMTAVNGLIKQEFNSSPESIRRQVEDSLRRLEVESIDLYYQHRIDPAVEPEIVADTMGQLIKEGKIKHWGTSNAPIDYVRRAHAITPITAMENQYSMVYRSPEKDVFPLCEELGIGFVAYSPLGNGFLSGRYSAETVFEDGDFRNTMGRFKAEVIAKNQVLLDFLKDFAGQKHLTPAQLVLAWELGQKNYIVPIPGTTKSYRLKENLATMSVQLTDAEMAEINQALDTFEIDETHF